jgi:hypothetical protein
MSPKEHVEFTADNPKILASVKLKVISYSSVTILQRKVISYNYYRAY